jgi:5-methylcytosine-specific restriction endonuclease McrA
MPIVPREDGRATTTAASCTVEGEPSTPALVSEPEQVSVHAPAPAQVASVDAVDWVAPVYTATQDQGRASQRAPAREGRSADELADANTRRTTRYVPSAVRRAVAERDGYRCTFVAPDGRRCQAETQLEFHHDQPLARGGRSTIEGLRLLCRAHNDYHAQLDCGAAHMQAAKKRKQRERKQVTSPLRSSRQGGARLGPRANRP